MAQTTIEATRPATIQEIYERQLKTLPVSEQFKLATMLMNGIPHDAIADYGDWSDEDLHALKKHSWEYISRRLEEEENGDAGTAG